MESKKTPVSSQVVEKAVVLSAVDLYLLGSVKSHCAAAITPNLIAEVVVADIRERLAKVFGVGLKKFLTCLASSGGVISGSLILQCIIGEKWESDIDIFVPIGGEAHWELFFAGIMGMIPKVKNGAYNGVTSMKVVEYTSGAIDSVIQVVTLAGTANRRDVFNSINRVFDLDICKNMFFVETVLTPADEIRHNITIGGAASSAFSMFPEGTITPTSVERLQDVLFIGHFPEVATKISILSSPGSGVKTERRKKYEARGFKFVDGRGYLARELYTAAKLRE